MEKYCDERKEDRMILKVKDIKVGARYRKDYPAMEELAEIGRAHV